MDQQNENRPAADSPEVDWACPDGLVTLKDLAERHKSSERTKERGIQDGSGPPHLKVGKKVLFRVMTPRPALARPKGLNLHHTRIRMTRPEKPNMHGGKVKKTIQPTVHQRSPRVLRHQCHQGKNQRAANKAGKTTMETPPLAAARTWTT